MFLSGRTGFTFHVCGGCDLPVITQNTRLTLSALNFRRETEIEYMSREYQ